MHRSVNNINFFMPGKMTFRVLVRHPVCFFSFLFNVHTSHLSYVAVVQYRKSDATINNTINGAHGEVRIYINYIPQRQTTMIKQQYLDIGYRQFRGYFKDFLSNQLLERI